MTQKVYTNTWAAFSAGRSLLFYADAHDAAVGIPYPGSLTVHQSQVYIDQNGYLFEVARLHFAFDQSADKIPSDATITSVAVNLKGMDNSGSNEFGWYLDLVSAIGSHTAWSFFGGGDFGDFSLLRSSTTIFASLADLYCSGDQDLVLNDDGIADIQSQIANNYLMLGARLSTDINNIAPIPPPLNGQTIEQVVIAVPSTITIEYTQAPVVTLPNVQTNDATAITGTQATLNGILNNDGGDPAGCNCHFIYGLDANLDDPTIVDGGHALTIGQSLSAALTGLLADTVYHFKASATNSAGTSTGLILPFTTPGVIPILGLPTVSSIGRYNATLECVLIDDGGESCILGFAWGTDANNLLNSVTVITGGTTGLDFAVDVHSFQPDTTYFFEAFAVNTDGLTVVSQVVAFHTDGALDAIPVPPGPPNPIFPIPPNPVINFANIGLAIGGTMGAMTLMFQNDDEKKKKKKQLNEGKK